MIGQRWSRKRRVVMSLLMMVAATMITLVVAEIAVRIIEPQRTMYPRWQFSAEYGAMLFPDRTMVHEKPGRWRFKYTTNEFQYRGPAIPLRETYERENVVVLGDSYSFGTGVNDGEEFSAVMADRLRGTHDVINLAVGGWGLTQEIRRYFEFGSLYRPGIVVLQFADNDLRDNFRNRVTIIENGDFVFRNSTSSSNWVKRFLSDSPIQRSQLYNLFRQPLALRAAWRDINAGKAKAELSFEHEVPVDQELHIELLDLFARRLHDAGVKLIVISAGTSFESAPFVEGKIRELESEGLLRYLETQDWLEGQVDYGSPEGHAWGAKAHAIIGRELAQVIASL